jgi:hypothetical protein
MVILGELVGNFFDLLGTSGIFGVNASISQEVIYRAFYA